MKNRISVFITFVCLSVGLVFNAYASEQVEIKLLASKFVPKDWSHINKPDFPSDAIIKNAVFLGGKLDSVMLLDDDNVTWENFIAELKTKPIKQSSEYLQQSADVSDYPKLLQYIVTMKNLSKKSQPFVGEIRLVILEDGAKLPKNWLFANGQKIKVKSYPALFSLIGHIYGGHNIKEFALPDLTAVEATLKELTGENYRYIIAVKGVYPGRP